MTYEEAIKYRNQIDEIEERLRNTRDREQKRQIENELDTLYQNILSQFDNQIELKSVEKIDEQSILFSEFLGRYLVFLDLSTSQIRNVYGEVIRLKMKGFNPTELVLLKPRLAYSTERKGTDGSRKFREVIEKALDKVIFTQEKQDELFQNFANFFEAILAYHRSFGGK